MSDAAQIKRIEEAVARQRAYFRTGATKPVPVRVAALQRLKAEIKAREPQLLAALKADLHKSAHESYMCELGLNLDELGYLIRKTPQWARPQRRPTPLVQYVSRSYEIPEPYGVVLVMSPWNYPYLLSLDPLFGAVAAGNCVILKPSAYSPHTSHAMAELIAAVFPPDWVTVIEGGRESFEGICRKLQDCRDDLRTVFTLETFDNLVKNGRMRPLLGTVLHTLGIHVIAAGTDQGTIQVVDKARGMPRTIKALLGQMEARKD